MGSLNGENGAVGYKRPPSHSRFVKGKSGNPKGRPKSTGGRNTLADAINRPVKVTLDGIPRKMPLPEATVMALAQKALSGNTAAAREFMKIVEKVNAEQKAHEETPIIAGISLLKADPKECNVALRALGAIELVGDSWRIQTWVIEAALAHNQKLVLKEGDRTLLANSMVDPEALPQLLLRSG